METASSETTLTDRRGCLDLTLDETSWTQMEREIRCAMLRSNFINSNMPESGTAFRWPPYALCHSLRIPVNELGSAASSTVTTSTIPMSSSSDRFASLAAATSSLAIPNETLNARSDPSEPRAPVVVAMADYRVNTCDVKVACCDCVRLEQVLASQQCPTLILRRLFICNPSKETGSGKSPRTSGGRSHRHGGCVVGCVLGPAVAFGRSEGARTSETLECMRTCLNAAGRDLLSCMGEDAFALQKGFASHRLLNSQARQLPELKSNNALNTRYGRSSAVLGAGAAVHFSLCSLASRGDDCCGLLMVCELWLYECTQKLRAWKPRAMSPLCARALYAEMRCLERGVRGVKRALGEFDAQGINDSWNRVRFMLACMRKAMWPRAKKLDASTQDDLLRWIESPEFVEDSCARLEPRPRPACTINVPLAAVPMLNGVGGGDSDASSAWDSSSSAASSLECSDALTEDAPDCESMAALSDLLESSTST